MAIKASLGRLALPNRVAEYVTGKLQAGLQLLPFEWSHASGVERLPYHHRDPFDRALIAQARAERLAIVTGDRAFRDYDVTIVW